MERLKNIDEGGSNLLDNSVVLFGLLKDGNGHVGLICQFFWVAMVRDH